MSGKFWTEEELTVLKRDYTKLKEELLELLPNRTWNAIKIKANKIGLSRLPAKIMMTCNLCKNTFYLAPSQVKNGMGKFCSKRCYDLAQNKKIEKACQVCETVVRRRPSNFYENVFCSLKCRDVWARRKFISETLLRDYYLSQKLTTIDIANIFKISRSGVYYQLKFYDIPIRTHKKLWKDEEYRTKVISNAFCGARRRPTKPERILSDIINKHDLPFKYVGDGSVWIYGLNPDFINCNGKKQIIEVFGDYWHSSNNKSLRDHQTEEGRKAIFRKLGYETLIVWEHELKDKEKVTKRLNNFCGVVV